MTDKLAFTQTTLKEGVTLYSQKTDLPVTSIRVLIPLGSVHSHPGNLGFHHGCAHFLEHMCFERSTNYNDKTAYTNLLAETGAKQNAWTDPRFTEYYLEAPAETINTILPAFLDHVFAPLFLEEDIAIQRGVIKNEREQRKYYPGGDELSQYRYATWQHSAYYSKEQLFGSDSDHAAMTTESLHGIHQHYHMLPVTVFVGGTIEETTLEQLTTLIPNREPTVKPLETNINPLTWGNRTYHTFSCKDISDPVYHLGSISTTNTPERLFMLSCIMDLLCDSESGTLQKWIRHENGWSYGLQTEITSDRDRLGFEISIPLSHKGSIDIIRTELPGRIKATLENNELFLQTKRRVALQACFNFETLNSRIDTAGGALRVYDQILTEARFNSWLDALTLTDVHTLYEELFHPDAVGEFLAVPKGE